MSMKKYTLKKYTLKKYSLSASLESREISRGWVYFLLEMTVIPSVLGYFVDFLGVKNPSLWINFLYFLLNFLACGWIFYRFLRENLTLAGKNLGHFWGLSLAGTVLAIGGNWVLGWVFQASVPGFMNPNDSAVQAMVVGNPLVMALGVVVLVPLAEECFFRGLLFQTLHAKNRYLAYGVSVVSFCAVHILSHLADAQPFVLFLCFLQYVPAALALCWAYERSDSFFCPIVIHAAVNAVGILSWR